MFKFILAGILTIHGLIHVIGFVTAFELTKLKEVTQNIPRTQGVAWLVASFLFLVTAVLVLLKQDLWYVSLVSALLLSQVLIGFSWHDTRFGTIPNLLLTSVAVLSLGSIWFESTYRQDLKSNLARTASIKPEILTEQDLRPLPVSVQKYLRYAGVLGKAKVKNMRVVFEGQMRDKGKDYFSFRSEQYNFFDQPTRLFFMKGQIAGLTVPGYHKYSQAIATMDIRLFGLFSVVKQAGPVMNKTETVTLFNDMCLLAPATLIDSHIRWTHLDPLKVMAQFENQGITVTATLVFNEQGQLINFISEDRTAISDMKQYPFLTPVSEYQSIQGMHLMANAEAVWQYPDGLFTYGQFNLKEIQYNLNS